tara:strand:- start:23 stop:379 length:357 start_codon:yes stop_codon:yes gene_type:complete
MATLQLETMADKGEKIVGDLVGATPTSRKAPFDLVTTSQGVAYEVKSVTTQALNGSDKIRISDKAWNRKMEFLAVNGYEGKLVVVVFDADNDYSVHSLPLDRKHIRISRAIRIGDKLN